MCDDNTHGLWCDGKECSQAYDCYNNYCNNEECDTLEIPASSISAGVVILMIICIVIPCCAIIGCIVCCIMGVGFYSKKGAEAAPTPQ